MNISLLCPTRIRPQAMEEFWESAYNHATHKDKIQICFYIDEDDSASINKFHELEKKYSRKQVKAKVGPRIIMSDNWNKCWEVADADIGCLCADDFRVETQGWDEIVLTHFNNTPDKILWLCGNDCNGQQEHLMGTFGFLHRRWIEAVGYFTPPYFSCDWCDTWINQVAIKLDRRVYDSSIIFRHLHPEFGTAPWDDSHRERKERGVRDNVAHTYQIKAAERTENANKLRNLLGTDYA